MSVGNVTAAMKKLNDVHLEMIAVGKEKQRAIIDNNSTNLTQLMSKENRLLRQMSELEQQRIEEVNSFLQDKGIRSQLNLSVTELVRLVFDSNEKEELMQVRDSLLNNALVLKRENELTTQLLEQSLHFIDFSLNIIVGVDNELIYKKPTDIPPSISNKNSFFDAKA
ncbi:flagellar protein FlgN [Paenibacillus sp. F411]|uniref:flagellar protein FlgN n=1 Tax=Paenibacillus sp. F411 TaxID=2820239 RepID=UPI001AB00771|nr:flagellar protein FlgN [Paenibacillus sp. F411]MBO2944849.1 flagellar protein FlgN [Paenibacillus sp. F411]